LNESIELTIIWPYSNISFARFESIFAQQRYSEGNEVAGNYGASAFFSKDLPLQFLYFWYLQL
jgi:hypothetical protein